MHNKWSWLCLLVLLPMVAWPQQYHGYDFATGVDTSKWITLRDDADEVVFLSGEWESHVIPLPFTFWLMDQEVVSVRAHKSGVLLLGSEEVHYITQLAELPMNDTLYRIPTLMPYGTRAYWDENDSRVMYEVVGVPGNRIAVFEFEMKKSSNSSSFLHWQVQLHENNQEFLFVYAPSFDRLQGPPGQIGWINGSNAYVLVNSLSHMAWADGSATASPLFWPGSWRWYSFVPHMPPCIPIDEIQLTAESNSIHAEWISHPGHRHYLVEYDSAGFPYGTGIQSYTSNSWINISGLVPGTDYEVRVRPVCDSNEAELTSGIIRTNCSNFNFANLHASNVVCRAGYFNNPSRQVEAIDFGSASQYSRHTVHYDPNERDPRTDSQLPTIPPGHCMSVRLGNWLTGGEKEDITYTLDVDTNEHDLLILRYAIVSQNPNHGVSDQPHFDLYVKDTAGNPLDECSYANFVSGDSSGWIASQLPYPPILWHDWSVMGIDLSRYHGQRIAVQLLNYDCSLGAHWGYAYYTLEWGSRHLVASNCGSGIENTYRAPAGFNYRWYSDSNPSVTLSTADTLHVTAPGNYGCHVSYRMMDHDCGFDLHTRAGERYPVARFVSTVLDSCGNLRRFTSRSVVASNAARTHLTDEPCEQFLWIFDDGTTDTLDRVTHRFGAGTHTVTLVAMLGGGTCRDTVSQTFTVDNPSDTLHTTVCPGTLVPVGDIQVVDTGYYLFPGNCVDHNIHVMWFDTAHHHVYDTVCDNGEVVIGGQHYNATGTYVTDILTDRNGCDSMKYLHLTVMDRQQDSVVRDTLCYGSELHYHGHVYNTEGEYVLDTLRWVHGCPVAHVLDLAVMPTYSDTVADIAVCGSLYPFADTLLLAPGVHTVALSTMHGCDSLFEIRLSCTDTIDTTVCVTTLPFELNGMPVHQAGNYPAQYLSHDGTDSLIEYVVRVRDVAEPQVDINMVCHPQSHYVITLSGPYQFSWSERPRNPGTVDSVAYSQLMISMVPSVPTELILYSDWPDQPSCPWTDTLALYASDIFRLGLQVTPEFLTSDDLQLRATEIGQGVAERHWFIDNLLQSETGQVLLYEASPTADSVLVTLTGRNGECADTLSQVIHVKKHSLWFPNVFTPDEEENTLFRAFGTGIVNFELWIYDRRGALMFHTTDINQGWDGTSDGKRCRQESYAYTCHYTTDHSGGKTHTGTVTLLR